jgi:hypothetical protein
MKQRTPLVRTYCAVRGLRIHHVSIRCRRGNGFQHLRLFSHLSVETVGAIEFFWTPVPLASALCQRAALLQLEHSSQESLV